MITLLSWKCSVFFKALFPRGIPADWSSCCFCYKPHCQQNTGWIPFHFLNFLIITMNILDRVPVQYVTLYYYFFFFWVRSFYILLRDFQCKTLTTYNLPLYLNTVEGDRTLCPKLSGISLPLSSAWRQYPPSVFTSPTAFWRNRGLATILFPFLSSTMWEFCLMVPFPVNQKHHSHCYGVWVDYGSSFQISMIYIIFFLLCNLLVVLYSCKSVDLTVWKRKIYLSVQSDHNQGVIFWSLGAVVWLDWYPLPLSH